MGSRRGKSRTSDRFSFLGLQKSLWTVTGAMKLRDTCSLEGKHGKLRQQLKSRVIILLTKVHLIKVIIFPVVTCRCESWTVKKTEDQKIDAFELWCWRRLLRVLWTARRSNQSILKEINPEYSLERLMLKLKLQYLGHLTRRGDSLEEILMLGMIEGKKRKGWQRMEWLDSINDSMDMSLSKFGGGNGGQGKPAVLQSMGLQRVRHDLVAQQQQIIYLPSII